MILEINERLVEKNSYTNFADRWCWSVRMDNVVMKPIVCNGEDHMGEPLIITQKYTEEEFQNGIITNEHICKNGVNVPVRALWDTGSLGTMISEKLSDGLKKIGESSIHSSGKTYKSDIFDAIVLIGGKVKIKVGASISSEIENSGIDMLIGLDIISLGDFMIYPEGHDIRFVFRYPSQKIDYLCNLR